MELTWKNIVLDALAQLRAGLVLPTTGFWVTGLKDIECDADTVPIEKTNKAMAQYIPKACSACAMGSLLLSRARLDPDFTLRQLFARRYADNHSVTRNLDSICNVEVESGLHQFFDHETLRLMESAFERGDGAYPVERSSDKYINAVAFGYRFPDETRVMEAILENLLENEGKFIPPPATEEEFAEVRWRIEADALGYGDDEHDYGYDEDA